MEAQEKIEEDTNVAVSAETRTIGAKGRTLKRLGGALFLVFFVAVGIFLFCKYRQGVFRDTDSFRDYINSFGYFGPVMLTFIQCVKVVYAVIPGFIGCIVGAGLFGLPGGFVCNYIGICAGSMLAFLLSHKFGISILRIFFSERKIRSYLRWMNRWTKHFTVFLWVAIMIPVSPDDFLCYFAGLTRMKFRTFAVIILTAKPFAVFGYSLIGHFLQAAA